MVSLILSNGIDTPHQSDVLLSLFKLEEFHLNLDYLTLQDTSNFIWFIWKICYVIYFEVKRRSDLDLCDGHERERFSMDK